MSNYGSVPPPGPYTAPGASTPSFNPQQQQSHPPGAPNQAHSGHTHKSGGLGQMMNQAVTTGKPMLNKLGKTISSKLGGKQAAGGPPAHLQSYANYQQHQGQGQVQQTQTQPQGYQQQQPGQTYSPQPPQQQWQPPQQPQQAPPQAHNAYAPQQSPYQQSNYATPASGHSGQSNYFPAQQPPGPPPGAPNYNPTAMSAPGSGGPSDQHTYTQQGQQGMPQGQYQQHQQFQIGQYSDQQTGTIGTTPSPGYFQNTQVSHMGDVSPEIPPNKPAMQPQWAPPSGSEQLPPPGSQQQVHSPMPPPPQAYGPGAPQPPYQSVPTPPVPHDQQQWNPASPVSPQSHGAAPPVSVSPSPHQTHAQPQPPSAASAPVQTIQPLSPAPHHAVPEAGPTEFIAELPADMGNLNLGGSKPSGGQYQAYHPQGEQAASPTNRFSVARRAVSSSSLPLADPWRFADPMTEQPTREFYILADLLFDALDRKFEPQNTGLLEAPKVLRSWMELTQDAHRLFSYRNYTAVANMWSLEGIPHIMVPMQSCLTPVWNFNQHSHAQDLKVGSEPQSTYATYIPALNRAGWYKFLFLEMNAGSDDLGKLLSALCADTYKPGVLNHPDLNRRDRADIPGLHSRAAELQAVAIGRVCEEAQAGLLSEQGPPATTNASQSTRTSSVPNAGQHGSGEDMAMLMHEIQMASNDMAVRSVMDGEVRYRPGEGHAGGYGRLV